MSGRAAPRSPAAACGPRPSRAPAPPAPAAASPLPPAPLPARAPPPAPRPPALLPGRRAPFGRVTCRPSGKAAVPPAPSPRVALPGPGRRTSAPRARVPPRRGLAAETGVRAGIRRYLCAPCGRWRRTRLGPGALRAGSPDSAEKRASAAPPVVPSEFSHPSRSLTPSPSSPTCVKAETFCFAWEDPRFLGLRAEQTSTVPWKQLLRDPPFPGPLCGLCCCRASPWVSSLFVRH